MEVEKNRVYRHYKGDYYIVIDIATNSETMEKMVIYRGLYENGPLWVRPYELFIDDVNKNNQVKRFLLQEIESKR
ncbi:MAG: DUF1653 domain-containing protein [Bacilli bacterium]|nr:DUF1653 domain-containing protein [Bacilli bacterium]